MEEVAHDAVARCPIVAVAGVVVGAEAGGAERGLTALGAETHDRKPRRPTDSSIAVLPGFGLDLSLGGDPTGQSCSFHTRRGAVGPLGGIDPLKRTTRAEEKPRRSWRAEGRESRSRARLQILTGGSAPDSRWRDGSTP